jgi:hypothetical protein
MVARPEVTGRKLSARLHGTVQTEPRPPPIGVTVSRAVELSGLSRSYIWVLIKAGRLKTTSVGRRRIIIYQSLRELIEGQSQAAPNDAIAEGSEKTKYHDDIRNPSGANLSNR